MRKAGDAVGDEAITDLVGAVDVLAAAIDRLEAAMAVVLAARRNVVRRDDAGTAEAS